MNLFEYLPWIALACVLFAGLLVFLWPESDSDEGLPFHPPWERERRDVDPRNFDIP
jgi:hypothetical protein